MHASRTHYACVSGVLRGSLLDLLDIEPMAVMIAASARITIDHYDVKHA